MHAMQGVDPYEFAEPVDITKALDKAFWEGLRSAKWQERKGSLQARFASTLLYGDHLSRCM